MPTIRTAVAAVKRSLPTVSDFLRTLASMMVRTSPIVIATAVSWLLLFYTEQGHDLLAGARGGFWQACRLLSAIYLLSVVAAYCTIYLLNLSPDWDSGRIFRRISIWDRKSEKKKAEQDKEKTPADDGEKPKADEPEAGAMVR